MQSSIYNMDLENEIHFIPALFFNVNLDPTRRYGSETSASLRVSDTVLLRGGHGLYPRGVSRGAVRRQRRSAGVPLHRQRRRDAGTSGRTISSFDATVRGWSERFMDNDQANTQRLIPASATVDFKLSGAYEHFFWSISRRTISSMRCTTTTRSRASFTAGPLRGLSAARPNLHGEGRRDVLTATAGSEEGDDEAALHQWLIWPGKPRAHS